MTVNISLFAGAGAQLFDNNGVPLAGGEIYTYLAGTSTPATTYTTSAGTVAQANPIVLDSAGRVPTGGEIWLTEGVTYKFVVKTSAGVTLGTYDNVPGNGSGIYNSVFATLALSSGSSLIGFVQDGANAVARTEQAKLRDFISVKDFGAVGDGVTDDTAAIQNALNSCSTRGGTIYMPVGNYLTSATLTISYQDTTLIGAGFSGDNTTVGGATLITATHTTGPVIRIKNQGCSVQNLTVSSNTIRYAAAAGSNYGILVEADDTSSALTSKFYINRVRVTTQPNHGYVFISRCEASNISNSSVDNVKGHGFLLDDGTATSRFNKNRLGQINIFNCIASRTDGHSIKIGDMSSIDNRPYRIIINNFEAFYNLQDKVTYTNGYNVYVFGENIEFRGSATSGTVVSGATTHGGMYVAGRNIIVSNHRFVDNEPYCAYVTDYGGTIFNTIGVLFEYLYINNSNQPAGYYNPAINVISTCQDVKSVGTVNSGGDISSLMPTNSVYNTVEFEGLKRYRGTHVASFKSNASSVSLATNKAGYFEFDNLTYGTVVVSSNVSGAGQAIVSFRCGDANAYCTVLSSGGATVAGTTGTLNGTTGSAGNLTFAADTATNRLYIENRTGSTRSYQITFLSTIATYTGYTAV